MSQHFPSVYDPGLLSSTTVWRLLQANPTLYNCFWTFVIHEVSKPQFDTPIENLLWVASSCWRSIILSDCATAWQSGDICHLLLMGRTADNSNYNLLKPGDQLRVKAVYPGSNWLPGPPPSTAFNWFPVDQLLYKICTLPRRGSWIVSAGRATGFNYACPHPVPWDNLLFLPLYFKWPMIKIKLIIITIIINFKKHTLCWIASGKEDTEGEEGNRRAWLPILSLGHSKQILISRLAKQRSTGCQDH